ncbi:hypothetical protein NDU88_006092 [Pleurodeles waltl]|uniref:Uncharacterized protein n=1 Tax=Pleurodeles waltl TaxID=8319 RepID=A0AAV7MBX4_PLEWA|nr:hypothetical protein NDU88_006092 [Pleurodeles waltl]
MDYGLAPDRNRDIRVSKSMKIVEGRRAARTVVAEEGTDAGERKRNVSTEDDDAESALPANEEENTDPSSWGTQDTNQDGAGDSEEPQFRHVPGGV